MEQQTVITENFLCSGAPTQTAKVGVRALDISTGSLYEQRRNPSGTTYVLVAKNYFQPSASGGGNPTGPAGGALSGTYPNPSLASGVAVPPSRTITINGLTQDLSVNRTWTVTTGISQNLAAAVASCI